MKDWTILLSRELDAYGKEENEIMFQCMSKTMKRVKKDIVEASPKGPKNYAKGWSVRTKRYKYGFDGIVFNRTHPRLTHLLEKSHVIRNQHGQYGRTGPGHGQVEHIGPAAEKVEEYFLEYMLEAHKEV